MTTSQTEFTDEHFCHDATSWEHARPCVYQTANQNRERKGYFLSPGPTYDQFGLREKQKKFQRFARVNLPEDCTIIDITSSWKRGVDRSKVWRYMLEATPLEELSYKEGNHHVATCPIRAGEQADMQ